METLYRDLALELGDAVWAFAKVEWLTYEYLGYLSEEGLDELLGDIGFRGRTAILRRLVARRAKSQEEKDRAIRAILEVEKLSDERNVIVHNPWKIWVDLDKKEFMTEIQKYSNREKKVNLGDLRAFTDRATVAEINLREALHAL